MPIDRDKHALGVAAGEAVQPIVHAVGCVALERLVDQFTQAVGAMALPEEDVGLGRVVRDAGGVRAGDAGGDRGVVVVAVVELIGGVLVLVVRLGPVGGQADVVLGVVLGVVVLMVVAVRNRRDLRGDAAERLCDGRIDVRINRQMVVACEVVSEVVAAGEIGWLIQRFVQVVVAGPIVVYDVGLGNVKRHTSGSVNGWTRPRFPVYSSMSIVNHFASVDFPPDSKKKRTIFCIKSAS